MVDANGMWKRRGRATSDDPVTPRRAVGGARDVKCLLATCSPDEEEPPPVHSHVTIRIIPPSIFVLLKSRSTGPCGSPIEYGAGACQSAVEYTCTCIPLSQLLGLVNLADIL